MKPSEPIYEIQIERQVSVPMRDGTVLCADVYRPKVEGTFPVLIERVAYELSRRCKANGEYFASRGYVFVGQNVRGKFHSGGVFSVEDDGWGVNQDGYDTVEWAGVQPWSNGQVGMLDGSYSGFTQYMVAPTRPPHLKALYVREGMGDLYDVTFRGGAFQLALGLGWNMQNTLADLSHETAPSGLDADHERLEKAVAELDRWCRHLPLKSCPPLEGLNALYFDNLNHPGFDSYWWPTSLSLNCHEVDTPMVHLGGWFDMALKSTLTCFQSIRARGQSEHSRNNQRLIVGPWIHGPKGVSEREVGELDFGPDAVFDLFAHRIQWYDYWLKGIETEVLEDAPVRVFVMGDNRWLNLETWPPENIMYQPIYFREGTGQSDASLNNGGLTFDLPRDAEEPDRFTYDPEDPVLSLIGYPEQGPTDHRPMEGRVLTYTTDAFKEDLTVIGPLKAVLYALSSAPDTDWVVRLCDVWPDGRSLSVCDGILRARYRDGLDHQVLMVPEQVYQFEIDLIATAQVFKAGHRLRVQVTSSDFPRYDRNLNTGGSFGEEARGQVAINTLFHDAKRASHILLPIIPSEK